MRLAAGEDPERIAIGAGADRWRHTPAGARRRAGRAARTRREINFARFRGRSLIELVLRGGLSSGSVFERWLDGVLEGRTFEDLELDLAVVATDVRTSGPLSPLEFRLDRTQKMDLYRRGYQTTRTILPIKFRQAGNDGTLPLDSSHAT